MDAANASLKFDGASVAKLKGKADSALLEAGGASRLGLDNLVLGEAEVKLLDASHASVDVRKTLKYQLSSVSHLDYSGTPPTLTGTKSKTATLRHRP